jgi:hypothetical protein
MRFGGNAQRAARTLSGIYPEPGPWTNAILWHDVDLVPPPVVPLADELTEILTQRLAPIALRYLRHHRVPVDSPSMRSLQRSAFWWSSISAAATIVASDAIELLSSHGIGCAVSKGPGIARVYPHRGDRNYSGIDLLVTGGRFPDAMTLLRHNGWYEGPGSRPPWRYFDRLCREAVNLRRDGNESVEIHHHLPPWVWSAGVDIEAMIARATRSVHLGGVELPCLSAEDNLLVVALHAVHCQESSARALIGWRDLVQLAGSVDHQTLVDRAREADLEGWVRAVLLALPPTVAPMDLIERLRPARIPSALRLRLLMSPDRRDAGVLRSHMLRLPIRNGIPYALGMALPSRQFLQERMGTVQHPYRSWWFGVRPGREDVRRP